MSSEPANLRSEGPLPAATSDRLEDAALPCPECGTLLRIDGRGRRLTLDRSAPPAPTDDEGIYCPYCHYNLTGLPSGHCPECGSLFDREQLRKAQLGDEAALMPWDDPFVSSGWDAFWRTTRIACGQPQRFTFAVSAQPHRTRARRYYLYCLLVMGVSVAMVVFMAAVFGEHAQEEMVAMVAFGCTPVAATIIGNLLWPVLYTILIVHPDGRRHYGPWRAIVHYASAHLLLYAPFALSLLLLTPLLIVFLELEDSVYVPFIMQVGAVGIFVLWALTMDAVLGSRSPASPGARAWAMWMTYALGAVIYVGTWFAMAWLAS